MTSRRCPGPGLIASSKTIDAKHDAISGFVAATLHAMADIKADPTVGLDAAIKDVPELGVGRATPGGHPGGHHRDVVRDRPGRARPRARSTATAGRARSRTCGKLGLVKNPVTTDQLVRDDLLPPGD